MKIRIDFDNERDGEMHEIEADAVRIPGATGPVMFGGNIGIYEIEGDAPDDFEAFCEKADDLPWPHHGPSEGEKEPADAETLMALVYESLDSENVLPDAEAESEAMVEATFREAAKTVGATSAGVQGDWEEVAKTIAAEIDDKFPEFMAAVEVIGREQAAANEEYNRSLDDPNEEMG